MRTDIVGWYDSPDQHTATHDPGMDALCIVCARTLAKPVVTISLLKEGGDRSFFFRCHKHCWESLDESERVAYESSVLD